MTNYERLISDIELLAKEIIYFDDDWGIYRTSDGETFEWEEYDEAIAHEVEWLKSEYIEESHPPKMPEPCGDWYQDIKQSLDKTQN